MPTPLIILASILALFALVLIPLMMIKGDRHRNGERQHPHDSHGKRSHKKRKKR